MAIDLDINLTNQPAVGSITYRPLGGDGFTAPRSMYMFDIASTGDASGGDNTVTVFRDERFQNIASFLQVQTNGVSRIVLFNVSTHNVGRGIHIGSTVAITGDSFSALMWTPPLLLDSDSWALQMVNTDTEAVRFKGIVYNFDIFASEKVPLSLLVASMPRSPAAL